MQHVLGVKGIPTVEVELLRIIIRLSSNLMSFWTVSETQACDVLLVEGAASGADASIAPAMVVPVVARRDAKNMTNAGPVLARPIYAEELVQLLNELEPGVRNGKAAAEAEPASPSVSKRARLKRWPSQKSLLKHPGYIRLATALTKSAQSARSLSALGDLPVDQCASFLASLEKEGVLVWLADVESPESPAPASALQDKEAIAPKMSLLSRIRRRLGLA